MRKKLNILFIVAMIFMLALCLVACNKGAQDLSKLPDEVGGRGEEFVYTDAYLKFAFPKQPSSVFSAIYVDEFNVDDVIYSIVYTDGKVTTEVNGGNLTEDMVDKDDRPLLSQVGHHMIHVTTTLDDGKVATGSFALHLKDHSNAVNRVTLKFNLTDNSSNKIATAYFGSVNQAVASVEIDEGAMFSSWEQFVREFRMAINGRALVALTYDGGRISPNEGFENGFEITRDMIFTGVWTDDIINVTYDLNLPSDATLIDNMPDPRPTFETSVSVQRNVGRIISPKTEPFNVFNGYYFAGWYVNDGDGKLDNDKLWNFSHTVGTTDIALYAKWTQRAYSFTLYTMGGVFKSGVSHSEDGKEDGKTVINSTEVAESLGYKVIPSTSRFSTLTGEINRIIFTGFKYGDTFDKYVAKVDVGTRDADGKIVYVFMKFTDVLANLTKGGDYVKTDGICKDSTCTTPANVDTMISDGEGRIDDLGYVKWVFNSPQRGENESDVAYADRVHVQFSDYMVNVVFKDNITLKTDGTLRLDKISDDSVNELKIPDKIKFNGVDRYITEIGDKAVMDIKTLYKLDLSEASHLTAIGNEAFSHCASLAKITMPTNNNIENVGRNVFYRTVYESNYSKDHGGLQFIIINKTLYNFVGEPGLYSGVAELDLSTPTFYTADNCELEQSKIDEANAQLSAVTRISAGALELLTNLERVRLGDNVERIDNYAFVNLKSLQRILVSRESKLRYIGEHAFEESAPIFTTANDEIIIGDVYYRFLDRTATQVTIPDNIRFIAPEAFIGCVNVEQITFLTSDIEEIGKDAFFSTQWIRHNDGVYVIDGFVIVNGILSEYFGNNFNEDNADIIIPQSVTKIAPYTFNSFAQDVKTMQIHSRVAKIGDYAFSGSTSLESIVFADITVSGEILVGAPDITDKTFLNQNDKIAFGLKLYFRQDVINLLKDLSDKVDQIADATTQKWVRLYNANKDVFVAEKVSSVWIDKSVVSTSLLKTGATENAYYDRYGKNLIEKALVVISNTGIKQKQSLDPRENQMAFVEITSDGKYKSLYEEGKTKYVITFTYHGSTEGCAVTADDENLFVFESTNAIKGVPAFFKSEEYTANTNMIDVSAKTEASDYWIDGFKGQVEGKDRPTFYTSNTGINVKFCYKDITGAVCERPIKILSFSTNVEKPNDKAIFSVDFNGLGEYRFTMNYAVVKSLFKEIRQSSSISIPLNGDPIVHFNNFQVELVGQDGISKSLSLNTTNFSVIAVDGVASQNVNTTEIGRHTMTIQYAKNDADGVLVKQVVYTVILNADPAIFQYEIVSDNYKTAKIVSVNMVARNADTLVLPETCDIRGTEYKVVEIGDRAFEEMPSLKSVYLSTTINKIGNFAFAGCALLENVYMVDIVGAEFLGVGKEKTQLGVDAFEVIRVVSETEDTIVKEVKLLTLADVDLEGKTSVKVRSSYTIQTASSGKKTIIYNVVQASENLAVKADPNTTKVYMPDTIYNHYVMTYNTVNYEPEIYHGEFVFHAMDRLPSALTYIGNSAFTECAKLKTIELSYCTDLRFIGVRAFADSGLERIEIPLSEKLSVLNAYCFENCTNLLSVTIHGNIKVIAEGCFKGCISLESFDSMRSTTVDGTEVLWEDSIGCQTIGNNAFSNCTNLSEITVDYGVENMGESVFSSCNAVVIYCYLMDESEAISNGWGADWSGQRPVVWFYENNIIADDGRAYVYDENGICYAYEVGGELVATVVNQRSGVETANIKSTIHGYDGKERTVTAIDSGAFKDCYKLKEVTLPSSVTRIESDAFRNCVSLTTFSFSGTNELVYISNTAFVGCNESFIPPTIKS